MCNDRNHPKIRSLANYCFDLRFQRPRVEQIKVRRFPPPFPLIMHEILYLLYLNLVTSITFGTCYVQGAMMSVAFKEGLKIPPPAMNEIILGANQDIRQVRLSTEHFIFIFLSIVSN